MSNKVGERKPPTTIHRTKIEKMNLQDLNKLHEHLANAVLVFMKYKQGDEKPLEIAVRNEKFGRLLFLELEVFNEIVTLVSR